MTIYFDSKTGNVARFTKKIAIFIPNCKLVQIDKNTTIDEPGHLITYTTKRGEVPETTTNFLRNHDLIIVQQNIMTVSSSGNRNWGLSFALAADIIAHQYKIPIALKFELSGNEIEVQQFLTKIRK